MTAHSGRWANLKQNMDHRLARFVENRVIDGPGLEEEFSGSIDDGLVRQDIGHIAGRDLTNSGPNVVVLAHVSSGREGQLCDPKLIFSIEISEKSREWLCILKTLST